MKDEANLDATGAHVLNAPPHNSKHNILLSAPPNRKG
nr:MAG TPA: hypothetical protein [Caudoviricetes sp.]